MHTNKLPETGFLRIHQIVSNKKRGTVGLFPMCAASWWNGVKAGRYPKPVKLGPRITAWRVEDLRQFMNEGVDRV